MLYIEESCNPAKCNLECISACRKIHGEEAPLRYLEEKQKIQFHEIRCTSCLKCVRVCPFDALRNNDIKSNEQEDKQRLQIEIERPYQIADSYTQFSEEDIIFARVQNDTEFLYFQKPEDFGAEDMISRKVQGYSRIEHKLSRAGWDLYDFRHLITKRQDEIKSTESLETNSDHLTLFIKRAALFSGAANVGIAKLDRRWLYSANRIGEPYIIPESIKYAIVALIEMDYDSIATSPAFPASAATALGYSKMAFVEIFLTAFIRHLGYEAIPCGNDIALSVPLAIDAGLGQYGRHGLLITKEFGSRVRIAKVLTDMPLSIDQPDYAFCKSVLRFCEDCEKCAEHCPNQCISFGKEQTWNGQTNSNNPGILKWYVNVESCYGFWLENGSDCSNCIRSCPYNKKGFKLRSLLWLTKHLPWLNKLLVKIDDIFGGGKQKNPAGAWNNLK